MAILAVSAVLAHDKNHILVCSEHVSKKCTYRGDKNRETLQLTRRVLVWFYSGKKKKICLLGNNGQNTRMYLYGLCVCVLSTKYLLFISQCG